MNRTISPERHASLTVLIALVALLGFATPTLAQADRLTIWDLRLGATIAEMPPWIAFKDYACGSNGGPPLQPLAGWQEYNLCTPEESGLYEVYFEYDDEAEYILRALNNPNVVQFVGTTDKEFPVVTSALFDSSGVLRGIRLITDPRVDYTNDAFFELAQLRPRAEHFLLGPYLGAQFGIDPDVDCQNLPLGQGEGEVGNVHIKLDCERLDETNALRYRLQTRYFRKPGQLARDPFTGQLTEGLFESLTRAEVYQLGYGPAESLLAPRP